MNTKKILIILFIVLALAVAILLYLQAKKKKADETTQSGAIDMNTNNGSLPAPGSSLVANTLVPPVSSSSAATNSNSGVTRFPLSKGSTGKAVKLIQAAVGAPITGTWDDRTDVAVRNYKGSGTISAQEFTDAIAVSGSQFPVQQGSRGAVVKDIQILVGADPDGIFGPQTEAALKAATGETVVYGALQFINLVNAVLGLNIGFGASTNGAQSDVMANIEDFSFDSQLYYL